ncbi:hypothetical protein Nepgr_018414 [Nepenthes gracilis]|uniref:Uncharacterized protein n=1 Tax=Nepenthes gracilis TaxID=150966 RepID=A0AAD3XTE3_NEPGR|nr:hypothetical protein Nepgr_018414 [Nepenthes gracilis]
MRKSGPRNTNVGLPLLESSSSSRSSSYLWRPSRRYYLAGCSRPQIPRPPLDSTILGGKSTCPSSGKNYRFGGPSVSRDCLPEEENSAKAAGLLGHCTALGHRTTGPFSSTTKTSGLPPHGELPGKNLSMVCLI